MYTRILVLIVATACAVNGRVFFEHDYQRTPLGDAIDKASMKLLNEAYKSAGDKNVVSSPLGIMTLLALFEEGAGPGTKQQIDQYLGVSDNQKSSVSYSDLSKKLAEEDPSYLTVANKIYVADKYTLNDRFADVAKSFESEVETLNFGDQEAAAAAINKWADEKTRGHIKDPVQADSMDSLTAAALFNVIFFQKLQQDQQQALVTQASVPKGRKPRALPNKPQGRMSAYAFFYQECLEAHKKNNPEKHIDPVAFSRKCADRWKTMSDKEKNPFFQMAEQDKQRYDLEMQSYRSSKDVKELENPNASQGTSTPKNVGNPDNTLGDNANERGRRSVAADPNIMVKYESLSEQNKARIHNEMTAYKKEALALTIEQLPQPFSEVDGKDFDGGEE